MAEPRCLLWCSRGRLPRVVPTEPGGAVLCVVGLGEQGLDGIAALALLGEVIAVGDLVEISDSRGGHGGDGLGFSSLTHFIMESGHASAGKTNGARRRRPNVKSAIPGRALHPSFPQGRLPGSRAYS